MQPSPLKINLLSRCAGAFCKNKFAKTEHELEHHFIKIGMLKTEHIAANIDSP
jgi:hypothetical protein